jgi:hypothetical protein
VGKKETELGRPPMKAADVRNRRVTATLTKAEEDAVVKAAQSEGKTASTWAREVILAALKANR